MGCPYLLEDLEEETGSITIICTVFWSVAWWFLAAQIHPSLKCQSWIHQNSPQKKRINRFIEFASRHYVNAQSFSPFGSGESHHRKNPRETTQPAPCCGGGTARSSAEPDESTQGSAHGNLGDLMTNPAESGRCRKRVMEDVWRREILISEMAILREKTMGKYHGILAVPYFQTNPHWRVPWHVSRLPGETIPSSWEGSAVRP